MGDEVYLKIGDSIVRVTVDEPGPPGTGPTKPIRIGIVRVAAGEPAGPGPGGTGGLRIERVAPGAMPDGAVHDLGAGEVRLFLEEH